jgi:ABC-type polysaccharide/polyol phosphate export permease
MSLKEFYNNNKYQFLWSYLALFLMGIVMGLIKEADMKSMFSGLALSFPIMFIMGFGIYEFTGGDKE